MAVELLFPGRCLYCRRIHSDDGYICADCMDYIKFASGEICVKCGRKICFCHKEKLWYDYCVAPFYYKDGLKQSLLELKRGKRADFVKGFAFYMADCVRRMLPAADIIAAVPMFPKREREIGFNHAWLLAKQLSHILGIESDKRALIKTVQREKQHLLNSRMRKYNLTEAIECRSRSVCGKNILLCDDITTSGATFNACAYELKNAGAKGVFCVAAAISMQN